MKTLHKTIKKQWFDMIGADIKKHEYLDIKPYWIKRLIDPAFSWDCDTIDQMQKHLTACPNGFFKHFDIVHAFNGGSPCYKYPNVKWEHEGITIGEGREEWGAEPGKKYFILKIGELIK